MQQDLEPYTTLQVHKSDVGSEEGAMLPWFVPYRSHYLYCQRSAKEFGGHSKGPIFAE